MAKKQFKAESKRLLELMINSIYTNREIFLRELISNASDATDKLYYNALKAGQSGLSREELFIDITADREARTLTISDHGCGMSKDELEQNLGTIAKSGSLAFKKENELAEGDVDIIGQFGVGFYAAFMVAKHVTVVSRAAGSEEAWSWASDGADGYTVTAAERAEAGTTITLQLKDNTENENYDEFLQEYRLRSLIKKYSDYIRYPIKMEVSHSRMVEDSDKDADGNEKAPEYEEYTEVETLNSMVPIWKKNKKDVTEEEYNEFYKNKFGDYENPLRVVSSSVEGAATYHALLFFPARAPFNYYSRDYEKGLQLYSSGVLIMDKCADLLPDYFSFVRGLVDSPDLSLNISRELLQHDRQLKVIATSLEKKIKSELLNLLKNDREKYEQLFKAFGLQMKFGIYSTYGAAKDVLSELLLYITSAEQKLSTLDEYVDRMKEEQKYIYYACGESVAKLAVLPQNERLKEQGYEVLYLTDDIDEFTLKAMRDYKGKEFRSTSDEDLGIDTEEEKEEIKKQAEESKDLLGFLKESLGEKVTDVVLTSRLKNCPVCLTAKGGISLEMEKVLGAMPGTEEKVKAQRVLEINAAHPVFETLKALYPANEAKLKDYAEILYTQALLIEGMPVEDPVAYTSAVCNLMTL
ncbi:molecular chaperone HtpG [Pygmaiobacter massiliensis]|uniref:molecular chaperone HtpG n=1 Tax=Pygmaiobacter massiliensis TaxID=1917873 RepID=UPI000C7A8AA5|nr:molecular chaperone HtpG [Pygmaiobacter massiliensis]